MVSDIIEEAGRTVRSALDSWPRTIRLFVLATGIAGIGLLGLLVTGWRR